MGQAETANGGAQRAEARAPLIVMVAANGSRKTKKDHPALPMTPEEIGKTAAACSAAGAAMIHLHVRDGEGRHSLDVGAYRAAIAAIRSQAGDQIFIQASTEAVGVYSPEQQMALVRELEPEGVSLAIKEIVPDEKAIPAAARFLGWVSKARIAPQYVLYSPEEVLRYQQLLERGIIPDTPQMVLFVLGRYAEGQVSTPADLLPFLAAYAGTAPWMVTAFGRDECACVLTAAGLGGHARVGFENNLCLSDGSLAPDNAALVRQVKAGAAILGRPLADAQGVREMMLNR